MGHKTNRPTAGDGAADTPKRRAGRGWGPFSGAQLTVVIVAVAAMFAIPTTALAAGGAFSSTTSAPAIAATNSSKANQATAVSAKESGTGDKVRFGVRGTANGDGGIGVQGKGAKFGVFSNGPLGVANGHSLTCKACVSIDDLASTLPSGRSESGMFWVGGGNSTGGYMGQGVTFAHPLPHTIPDDHIVDAIYAPSAHCPGRGKAEKGYLCLYGFESSTTPAIGYSAFWGDQVGRYGATFDWTILGPGAWAEGVYTVTAP